MSGVRKAQKITSVVVPPREFPAGLPLSAANPSNLSERDVQIREKYVEFAECVVTNLVAVIVGPPGAGKSVFTLGIVTDLAKQGLKCVHAQHLRAPAKSLLGLLQSVPAEHMEVLHRNKHSRCKMFVLRPLKVEFRTVYTIVLRSFGGYGRRLRKER